MGIPSYTITTTSPLTAKCLISVAALMDSNMDVPEVWGDTLGDFIFILNELSDAAISASHDDVKHLAGVLRRTADQVEKAMIDE